MGNLGDLFIKLGKWDEAEQNLLESIRLCTSLLPAAAGAFSGSLAWLYSQQSKHELAQKMLEEGEPMVAVFPFEHAKFLCRKARVLHAVDETQKAKEAYEQAKSIAEEIDKDENSELRKFIREVESDFIATSESQSMVSDDNPMIIERSEEELQQLKMQARMLLEKGSLDNDESSFDEAL